jgi:hypothetical protein
LVVSVLFVLFQPNGVALAFTVQEDNLHAIRTIQRWRMLSRDIRAGVLNSMDIVTQNDNTNIEAATPTTTLSPDFCSPTADEKLTLQDQFGHVS